MNERKKDGERRREEGKEGGREGRKKGGRRREKKKKGRKRKEERGKERKERRKDRRKRKKGREGQKERMERKKGRKAGRPQVLWKRNTGSSPLNQGWRVTTAKDSTLHTLHLHVYVNQDPPSDPTFNMDGSFTFAETVTPTASALGKKWPLLRGSAMRVWIYPKVENQTNQIAPRVQSSVHLFCATRKANTSAAQLHSFITDNQMGSYFMDSSCNPCTDSFIFWKPFTTQQSQKCMSALHMPNYSPAISEAKFRKCLDENLEELDSMRRGNWLFVANWNEQTDLLVFHARCGFSLLLSTYLALHRLKNLWECWWGPLEVILYKVQSIHWKVTKSLLGAKYCAMSWKYGTNDLKKVKWVRLRKRSAMIIHCGMYYKVFTQAQSQEDRKKRLQRGHGIWVASWGVTRRAPTDGMGRRAGSPAGGRDSKKWGPGPHTGVKCTHPTHWVDQSSGKRYYVSSMFLSWVGMTQTGLRSGPYTEGLIVKSAQNCW